MRQSAIITRLKNIFPTIDKIDAAILYGSLARNEATPNSDIDIQLIVSSNFDCSLLKNAIMTEFKEDILTIHKVDLRNKVVVYFKHLPKMEIALCKSLDEISRNYSSSEITNVKQTILYERLPESTQLEQYLNCLISDDKSTSIEQQITELIDKFIYEFESCSNKHRRSDGYQFYFFYNIALHVAAQLRHIKNGHRRFIFLPKYFLSNSINSNEQSLFYDLNGSIFLPEANNKKRKLLDFFYESIQDIVVEEKFLEIKTLCDAFYHRDFFWNFRDISTYNPLIKPKVLFRTATMTVFQNEKQFEELLAIKNIKTVIDLRADREIEEKPYLENSLLKFKHVKAQLDPWNQPEWFKNDYHYGTNEEIAYRFFAIGCRDKIKKAFEAILNEQEGAVAVHCFAGKDRTGIFISMIHLLTGAPMDTIEDDYLASEVDVKLYRLKMVLDIIESEGGIEPYLINCGLTEEQLTQLKEKLMQHGNN
jgi:predicted nucleotidyltransferase/protein tyrosine phosphatase (PTP) superfamily phosphohydrolase (DUF442 family)